MSKIDDLAAVIRAGLDAEEQLAQAAHATDPGPWTADSGLIEDAQGEALWECEGARSLCMTDQAAEHAARHDPARVLAEVASKRALLDKALSWEHERDETGWCDCEQLINGPCTCGRDERVHAVLTHLAQPYQETT